MMINLRKHHYKFSHAIILLCGIFVVIITFIFYHKIKPEQFMDPPNKVIGRLSSCIALYPDTGPYQESQIKQSGKYCVNGNFWQKKLSDLAGHSGPNSYRHLISVRASDVHIDLSGHTLRSDGNSGGIDIGLDYMNRHSADPKIIRLLRLANNVTITNGVLDLRGSGIGITLLNKWRMSNIDEKIPERFSNYDETTLTLDNLLIKTDNMGLVLEGNGNIIRNCVIESGGVAAISIAGNRGKIINNRITLTNPIIRGNIRGAKLYQFRDLTNLLKARREPKAAIVLHQATDTIISGNYIEVKGNSQTRHNIYIADDSVHVRIEGNTFVGNDDPAILLRGSSATIEKNIFKPTELW